MNSENKDNWVFRFFVSGKTPNVDRAVARLQKLCEDRLEGMCDIEVIDIMENPLAAMEEDIIATPTLVKKSPAPERRIVGDLSDKDKLLFGLGIL